MSIPLYHHRVLFSSRTLDSAPLFVASPSIKSTFVQNTKPNKCITRSFASETLSKSDFQRIAEKLHSLGYLEEDPKESEQLDNVDGSAGEIFIPLPHQLSKYRVGHTLDSSWGTPENPVPKMRSGAASSRLRKVKSKVQKQSKSDKKEESVTRLAELTIPGRELRRLRTLGIALKKILKVGKAGITEGIVNGIHERWRRSEVVKIKCQDICKMNMKRTHEILERKTGGMVIWRSGGTIILYRGADYKYPYFILDTKSMSETSRSEVSSDSGLNHDVDCENPPPENAKPLACGVGSPDKVRFQLPGEIKLAEEADRLLDGLGPRFTDWWGYDPMPVDADLLPGIIPGYRRPLRLLPYGVKPQLTNDEMTILKRLSRPLPCHFVVGRNKNLQGLAESMVKLWEKYEIAKIAFKRGVQNTDSQMMAEELKRLTGGMLLSRDSEFIVFYRGKDFLPVAVSAALNERRKHGIEKEMMDGSSSILIVSEDSEPVGKNSESVSVVEIEELSDRRGKEALFKDCKVGPTKSATELITTKLSVASDKKEKVEKPRESS